LTYKNFQVQITKIGSSTIEVVGVEGLVDRTSVSTAELVALMT